MRSRWKLYAFAAMVSLLFLAIKAAVSGDAVESLEWDVSDLEGRIAELERQ